MEPGPSPKDRQAGSIGSELAGHPELVLRRKCRTRPSPLQFAGSVRSCSCFEPVNRVMRRRRPAKSIAFDRSPVEKRSVLITASFAVRPLILLPFVGGSAAHAVHSLAIRAGAQRRRGGKAR